MVNIIINKKVSFYNNKAITDDMIMSHVGVVTYSYLCRKFPNIFSSFHECKFLSSSKEGYIPSEINLKISTNPYEIKEDLIKSMCENDINRHSFLVGLTDKPNYPLIEKEETTYSWIFISIIMIILIIIAVYTLYYLGKKEVIN